jgi:Ca2+-binding EF-hand superfamily protein
MSAAEPEPEENNDGAFHVSYPRAPPLVSQSSEVVPGMRQDDIKAAFKIFDKDGDGTISSSELLAILTRGNTGILSLEDAKAILKDFDANGDGVLSISEFTKALASDFGDAVRNSEVYTTDLYNRRIEPHLAAIKALFDRLDLDKSGFLSCDEMKDVVSFYVAASNTSPS